MENQTMDKKTYAAPAVELLDAETEMVLAGSVTADGIGWGGIDTEGTGNPEAPAFNIFE
jgi:hypothetical protein